MTEEEKRLKTKFVWKEGDVIVREATTEEKKAVEESLRRVVERKRRK